MTVAIPGAPATVVAALKQLKLDLAQAAGTNLSGLILYGGLARGRVRPGKSDVNVVVLLNDASAESLTAIAPALRAAWRAAAVEPMVLTPLELEWAAEAFPTKFLDIKHHHIVLTGWDPFLMLEVARERIRLRIEQELRNLLLRLRRRYLAIGNDAATLAGALAQFARPFALQLEALLQYAGKNVPAEDRSAAIFEAAAAAFGLEREPLGRLAELRQNGSATGDVLALYGSVLKAVARAAEIASQMKEPAL